MKARGGARESSQKKVLNDLPLFVYQVVDMAKEQEGVTRSPVYISAHENELQCISINSKVGGPVRSRLK